MNWGRVALLLLPIVFLVGLSGFGAFKLFHLRTDRIMNVIKPETLSSKNFESLRKKTLEDPAYEEIFFHLDQYDSDILEFVLKDEDRLSFAQAYPKRESYKEGNATLEMSSKEVLPLLQWDLRWGYVPYGDGYLYQYGCAPTCLSMVFSFLKQDPALTPDQLAQYSMQNGYYVEGIGTDWTFLDRAGEAFGVNASRIPCSVESMQSSLQQGQILVCSMLPGDFTTEGHFIVIDGLQDGQFSVRDPNSKKHTQKLWNPQTILEQTQAIWAYSV